MNGWNDRIDGLTLGAAIGVIDAVALIVAVDEASPHKIRDRAADIGPPRMQKALAHLVRNALFGSRRIQWQHTLLLEVAADPPILVGGGAVELYTQGVLNTGDFDLVSSQQTVLEAIMAKHGFIRPKGAGLSLRGWIHPDLKLGFEVVGSRLLDGLADNDFLRVIEISDHGAVAVISVEDLIADRMGQFASGSADEMLDQAKALFKLSKGLDHDYMDRRIREETAQDYGVQDLEDET